ncbi:MAG TPA: hypothetical protein P5044_06880, partial [bacterium]|nr:hypothetical protein [bacterium]
MRRIISVIGLLTVLFVSFNAFAESKVVVISTGGKTTAEQKLAKDITSNLSLLFSTIRGASVVGDKEGLTSSQRSAVARCEDSSKCILKVVTEDGNFDYVIIPKVKIEKGAGIRVSIIMYDKDANKVGS